MATVERIDHWLNDGDGPVISSSISPGFKIVNAIDVPKRLHSSFIAMRAEMDDCSNFVESVREVEVGGRGVDRIGVENDQPVHLAAVHVGDERFEFVTLNRGHGVDGFGVDDGLADVAERTIDGDGSQMNAGRLLFAWNDAELSTT